LEIGAQEQSPERHARIESLLIALRDAVMEFNAEGNLVFCNPAAMELFGYASIDSMIGRHRGTFFASQEEERLFCEELEDVGTVEQRVFSGRATDGSILYLEATGHFIPGEEIDKREADNTVLKDQALRGRMELVVRDVTARISTSLELRRVKEFSENVIDNAPIGIVTVDSNNEIAGINYKALTILGMEDGDELLNKNIADIDVLKPLKEGNPTLLPVLEKPFSLPHASLKTLQGTLIAVRIHGVPLTNQDGSVRGGVIIFEDISEKETIERDLVSLQNYHQEVVEAAPLGIITFDGWGRILGLNKSAVSV